MDKPTLILDVDGVLADLETSFINKYNKDYNDNQTHFHDWSGTNLKADWDYKLRLFSSSDFFENLAPIDMSREAVHSLLDIYDITIATVSHSGAASGKLKWLDKYFGFIKNKAILVSDDFSIKKNLHGFVLVDDKQEHLEEFNGISVCFGDYMYNKNYKGIKTKDWIEARKTLIELSEVYSSIKNIERGAII